MKLKGQEIPRTTISALCRFFLRTVPLLPETYSWKTSTVQGFTSSNCSQYQSNLDLKAYFKNQWETASNEERSHVAEAIVSDWGGIRANKSETLAQYVNAVLESEPPSTLQGVSSYSKIFAVVHPDRFAIYDARVAACLNAVQFNAQIEQGLFFNYVPGRNKTVGNIVLKQGFTQDARFSKKTLVTSGWSQITRNQTYQKYLEVLSTCKATLDRFDLVSLEMALFANAESECLRAMG